MKRERNAAMFRSGQCKRKGIIEVNDPLRYYNSYSWKQLGTFTRRWTFQLLKAIRITTIENHMWSVLCYRQNSCNTIEINTIIKHFITHQWVFATATHTQGHFLRPLLDQTKLFPGHTLYHTTPHHTNTMITQ